MREELGVFPHNMTVCGPLICGDRVVVTTSNGVDWTNFFIPNPRAQAMVMLDKKTGGLLGEEADGVSSRTLGLGRSFQGTANLAYVFAHAEMTRASTPRDGFAHHALTCPQCAGLPYEGQECLAISRQRIGWSERRRFLTVLIQPASVRRQGNFSV